MMENTNGKNRGRFMAFSFQGIPRWEPALLERHKPLLPKAVFAPIDKRIFRPRTGVKDPPSQMPERPVS
jgi:hypothetical protein